MVWQFLKKLNTYLPYDLDIPLLDIYPKEMKLYVHRKISAQMFIAILFELAKNHKQEKSTCPLRSK